MDAISIRTARPLIDIRSKTAQLNFDYKIPSFELKSKITEPKMTYETPTFRANMQEVQAEIRGITGTMAQNLTKWAQEEAAKGLARMVRIGDQMGDLAGGASVAKVLWNNMPAHETLDIGMRALPIEVPRMEWDTGGLTTKWTEPVLEFYWDQAQRPKLYVEPYDVEVTVRGESKVYISVLKNATELGLSVDELI